MAENPIEEREGTKERNYRQILQGFHSESRVDQLYYLKTFMKIRDLLEAEVTSLLRAKGADDDTIAKALNKVTGRAKFAVSMEQTFGLPQAPSEKISK